MRKTSLRFSLLGVETKSICQHNDERRGHENSNRAEIRVREKVSELLLHEEHRQVVRASQERRNLEVRPKKDHVERVQFSLQDAERSLLNAPKASRIKGAVGWGGHIC